MAKCPHCKKTVLPGAGLVCNDCFFQQLIDRNKIIREKLAKDYVARVSTELKKGFPDEIIVNSEKLLPDWLGEMAKAQTEHRKKERSARSSSEHVQLVQAREKLLKDPAEMELLRQKLMKELSEIGFAPRREANG